MFFDDKFAQLKIDRSLKEYHNLNRILRESNNYNVELEFVKNFRR